MLANIFAIFLWSYI